jgi:hypothetical protein
MCYEATIASADEDEATLTKSLIISLEDITANWYSRLSPKCIYSWHATTEREVPVEFLRVPSGAQHRRRFPLMRRV